MEFLVDSLVVGGAERVVEALCLDLPSVGIRTGVGCLRDSGPIGADLHAAGVPLVTRLAPRRRDLLQVAGLRSHLRGVRADLVYVLDHSNALFYGRLAARSLGLPQVCAVHRTRRSDGSPSLGRADRWLMPLSQRVIAVSEGHARYLVEQEGLSAERVAVVHNGVDPGAFEAPLEGRERAERRRSLGLPPEGALVAVVAALRPEKNHELLLESLLRDPVPAATHVVVVGDGPRRGELKRRARELGLEERVHWLGRRNDVPSILAAVDALVLPSHPNVETFPLCVLEAMAAARPVVATDVGSLSELVDAGRTGSLVEAGDADALARELGAILRDPARLRQWGEAGRRRVEREFTRARMVARTAELLRSLLRDSGS